MMASRKLLQLFANVYGGLDMRNWPHKIRKVLVDENTKGSVVQGGETTAMAALLPAGGWAEMCPASASTARVTGCLSSLASYWPT